MDTRPGTEIEFTEAVPTPPRRLAKIVEKLTPSNDRQGREFILPRIWKEDPSLRKALPRVAVALADTIYVHARDGFGSKMAVVQACILFIPFAGVLSAPLLLILCLTFAALIVREAYVRPDERLEWEIITTFWTPTLIVGLHILLGWKFPLLMMPAEDLMPRIAALSAGIGYFRYNFAPHAGPEHPYKGLMRLHHRVWFFNDLWIAGALTYLTTVELAAPAKWHIQAYLTITPAMMFFSSAVRLQLNPIAGISRHRRIEISLLTDPYEDELRMKRDYLLTGADWFRNFDVQSLYEIVAFAFGLAPLLIGLLEWFAGDPNAERINWPQMAVNGEAWIGLMVTWSYVKRINRETAVPFDETLTALRKRSRGWK